MPIVTDIPVVTAGANEPVRLSTVTTPKDVIVLIWFTVPSPPVPVHTLFAIMSSVLNVMLLPAVRGTAFAAITAANTKTLKRIEWIFIGANNMQPALCQAMEATWRVASKDSSSTVMTCNLFLRHDPVAPYIVM